MKTRKAMLLALTMTTLSSLWAGNNVHGDHKPKHGGEFFMAPDGFHHLEGVVVENELRIYIYDAHTKPLLVGSFVPEAKAKVQSLDKDGKEVGKRLELKVRGGPENKYLTVVIPTGMPRPATFYVWLVFPKSNKPELFNFSLKE
jgi:hypothetical protein